MRVTDNGPGIPGEDVPRVFGEYLASSKFGLGRCSRGQQGIGISAATTWAQQTTANGAAVTSKTKTMKKAFKYVVEVDLKNNKGRLKSKQAVDWDRTNGTSVEFIFDGRIQMNGDAGLLSFIKGNILVNPHMSLRYRLLDNPFVTIDRITDEIPTIPKAVEPHPHTMQLGDFVTHAGLYGSSKIGTWLRKGFSRVGPQAVNEIKTILKVKDSFFNKAVSSLSKEMIKNLYAAIQKTNLKAPSTQSVLSIGEESLAKSVRRIGEIDFIAVHTRKPAICDFKPTQIEVAIARTSGGTGEESASVLRFANRVPLQFDKASCAIVKAIQEVNWRTYGLRQSKGSLPLGPYIIAVSMVSPFIKFKNASKETIDASDELVEEIRRGLMKAGQNLSRHLKRETKALEFSNKVQHLEQFAPILVDTLCRITDASDKVKAKASEGLVKILAKDMDRAKLQLDDAAARLNEQISSQMDAMPDVFKFDKDTLDVSEEVLGSEVEKTFETAPPKKQTKSKQSKKKKKSNKQKTAPRKPTTSKNKQSSKIAGKTKTTKKKAHKNGKSSKSKK